MNSDQTERLWTAINKTSELFKTRTSHDDWQRNIVDGCAGLESKMEWANYYTWLSAPKNFEQKKNESDFDFTEHDAQKVYDAFEYPEGVHEVYYKNGTETIIHVVNDKWKEARISQDEEKESV